MLGYQSVVGQYVPNRLPRPARPFFQVTYALAADQKPGRRANLSLERGSRLLVSGCKHIT